MSQCCPSSSASHHVSNACTAAAQAPVRNAIVCNAKGLFFGHEFPRAYLARLTRRPRYLAPAMSFDSPPLGLSPPASSTQLTEPPRFREGDRVKWTGPARSKSDGKLESIATKASATSLCACHLIVTLCAGKSFYNEVSVSMAGVQEVLVGSLFGSNLAASKNNFAPESEW